MLKFIRKTLAFSLSLLLILTSGAVTSDIDAFAATSDELKVESIFLKQQTSKTCTLTAVSIMLRRTAICSGYAEWENINDDTVHSDAWRDGVGVLWSFTSYGMAVGHDYFTSTDKKQELIELLNKYPQGIVVYNGGSNGQYHAVFLCDYNKSTDTFYVADPSPYEPLGRIPLSESSIVGATQQEQIDNFTAYWYVFSPSVTYKSGKYTASEKLDISNKYHPENDIATYNASKKSVGKYFVVTDSSESGSALRYYPSGSATAAEYLKQGSIVYVEYEGNNNFGAKWYKTDKGYYIFSSNLTELSQYSYEIQKFNHTAASSKGTYYAKSASDTKVALRIEPSEGNNIVGYINNNTSLYITHYGFNSAGAKWLKTEDGYYVSASEMVYKSADKLANTALKADISVVSGYYSSEPVENIYYFGKSSLYFTEASALNVRTSAPDGEIIGSLSRGTLVEVLAVSDGWGKILYDGKDAWISLSYAQKIDDSYISKVEGVNISNSVVSTTDFITCTVETNKAYTYKYSVYNSAGTAVYTPSGYSNSDTFTYKPAKDGEYYIKVEMKDSANNITVLYSANFSVYTKLVIDSVVSNVSEDAVYTNTTIKWTVKTKSVSSDAVYVYRLYRNGYMTEQFKSNLSSYSFTPESGGTYVLEVYLEDEYSYSDTVKSDEVTVKNALKINSVTLNTYAAKIGENVTCTVSASGGDGGYTYSISLHKDGTLIQQGTYSSDNTLTASFDESGRYVFYCYVRDASGNRVSASKAVVVSSVDMGDVDGNGVISSGDARLALRHAAKLESISDEYAAVADVNNDGKIASSDARLILQYAARLINSFS